MCLFFVFHLQPCLPERGLLISTKMSFFILPKNQAIFLQNKQYKGMETCLPFVRLGGIKGWHKGLAINVDKSTRRINVNADGTFEIFSLTKNPHDWNERKIIHKIDVSLKKNIVAEFDGCLQFGIVRVKKVFLTLQSQTSCTTRSDFGVMTTFN